MLSLGSKIEDLPKIQKPHIAALKKLGILSIENLLLHFPYRYLDFSKFVDLKDVKPGESVTIKATIKEISSRFSFRGRMSLAEAIVSDETSSLKVIWFNQPYLAKTLKNGDEIFLAGTPEYYKNILQLSNPIYEKVSDFPVHTARLVPVYHLTKSLYLKTFRNFVKTALPLAAQLVDELPADILNRQNLPNISNAVFFSHFPENAEQVEIAKKRLAFEEIFYNQLAAQNYKLKLAQKKAFQIKFNQKLVKNFVDSLPFQLTLAQKKASWEILQDLEKAVPMNRLLEGDVGSGKTLVALISALETANQSLQAVILAPTEILAKQHYETAKKYLKKELRIKNYEAPSPSPLPRGEGRACPALDAGVREKLKICLLTNNYTIADGEEIKKSNLHKLIAKGMPGIYFGTHALLQKKVKFKNLGLVIIDEQHRFGVEQRAHLISGTTLTETPDDADEPLLYKDLTYKIRECIFEVKKEIGLGHKEIIYQNALALKFAEKNLFFEKEKNIPVIYQNKKIGSYQPDFVIEDKILLELKALPFIGKLENTQIWTYLKGSSYKLALLVNFAHDDVQIKRIIYDTSRQRKSALSPRNSAEEKVPHLLSLTATPIPRTLQLAFFGELDISQIKTKPLGRKPILTKLVENQNRLKAYNFIKEQINKNRQIFVITPLIEESDKLGVKAAKTEIEKLKKIFPDFKIDLMHGRLKGTEKEQAMENFLTNKTQILVSTSVVEVGVDIPNASVMLIEGAERFGLAQLHQFRGRVGRAEHQSYCFLFTDKEDEETKKRLLDFTKTNDGFELAELDLKQRGFGEIYGSAQSGWNFKYFNLSYTSLIEPAREEAKKILEKNLDLTNFPLLKAKIKDKIIHFE